MFDFFLAGVIQGSRADRDVEPQDYRTRIKDAVATKTPTRTIYCPVDHHRDSPAYDDADAARVFHHHIELATRCRFLIAVLPTASMGTAIEMWECARAGVPVLAITPMTHNWVVRLFSAKVFRDIDEFRAWLSEDALGVIVRETEKKSASRDT
ncbi:MAG: hypothetical protein IT350_02160 [Deltaproteobacteria bacterium]|nr:hypothetical protein [Deltaproteobacteria bacterium]